MAACVHSSGTPTADLDDYVTFCRPNFPDSVSCAPIPDKNPQITNPNFEDLWPRLTSEARSDADQEPILSSYYSDSILRHGSMESALANHLSAKLGGSDLPCGTLFDLFAGVLAEDPEIMPSVNDDLRAVKERDSACISYVHCFLHFKGFTCNLRAFYLNNNNNNSMTSSSSVYLNCPSLHSATHPLFPMSTNFIHHRKPRLTPSTTPSMAACVHSSGTPTADLDDYVTFCRPNFPDSVSCAPISEDLWPRLMLEVRSDADQGQFIPCS